MLFNLLYLSAMLLVSPWIAYRAIAQGRYRRGVRQKLFGLRRSELSDSSKPTAWFHAVSVGEVNLIPGIVAAFKNRHPHWRVVVSCSTDTGYDLARERLAKTETTVFFCPLDFTWAVRRTIKTLQPQLLVLTELELWPNLVRIASDSGCQCAIINARLSHKSGANYLRFQRYFKNTFARIAWIGCQDHDYAARFLACGAEKSAVTVTGSLKFDNAPSSRDTTEVHQRLDWSGAHPWHQILFAGSTHAGEEKIALDAYKKLYLEHPELRLAITPRHATRFDEVARLVESMGFECRRRSQSTAMAQDWGPNTVILIDTIGELTHWWGTARIAFVGGGFGGRGGQNMLEPAGYGAAVCFGPNTKNFEDITRRLLAADGAVQLQKESDLAEFVARCLIDPPAADRLGIHAQAMVMSHRGATQRTMEHLAELAATREVPPMYVRAA